jgi:nicotinamide mononucleotide transporter
MRAARGRSVLVSAAYAGGVAVSVGLIAASLTHVAPMDITEVLGFVTGAWAVWLTVKENIWNWPIGIANDVFYIVLFLQARLFADTALQVIYVVLGFLGWYWWLRGGEQKTVLRVSRTSLRTAWVLLVILGVSTWAMTLFLAGIHDSAPFLDALTTTLSLIAQYMLTRKLFENWFVWITADVIYIGLYIYKELYLTAGLYAIFLAMCVAGLWQWRRSMAAHREHGWLEAPAHVTAL